MFKDVDVKIVTKKPRQLRESLTYLVKDST